MDSVKLFHGLHFHNHFFIDQQVETVAGLKRDTFVMNW